MSYQQVVKVFTRSS